METTGGVLFSMEITEEVTEELLDLATVGF